MSLWLGFLCVRKESLGLVLMQQGYINIFHLYPHYDLLDKSSLRDSDEELESRTTEKIEVSSAKSLTFEVSPSSKSLIQTKNNKGSRTEPCGTPAS